MFSLARMSAHKLLFMSMSAILYFWDAGICPFRRGSSFMRAELHRFLLNKRIAASRTTAHNPACNGQMEKYNGAVWKAITMALKTRGLSMEHWQDVLPDALHSLRSLLCTATNCSPHERLFNYERQSSTGGSVPSWLITSGPVLLECHVRTNKDEPLVDKVELLQANPQYAHVRYTDGQETTVSLHHLAPLPEYTFCPNNILPEPNIQVDSCSLPCDELFNEDLSGAPPQEAPTIPNAEDAPPFRHSMRNRQPPDRLSFKTWGE